MSKALLIMDFINDIVSKNWKLAGKWYPEHIEKNNVIPNLKNCIKKAREKNILIVFIKIWFDNNYTLQPKNSPLFWKANEFMALNKDAWWWDFVKELKPQEEDYKITKHRISWFYQTNLDLILRNNQINTLYLTWVSTDLVVESTARDAHDKDFNINIISNCCAAANEEEHQKSLNTLQKIWNIIKEDEF